MATCSHSDKLAEGNSEASVCKVKCGKVEVQIRNLCKLRQGDAGPSDSGKRRIETLPSQNWRTCDRYMACLPATGGGHLSRLHHGWSSPHRMMPPRNDTKTKTGLSPGQ